MSSERLLIRGVNWLGDAVMSTPALLQLRRALPGARIALVTAAKLQGIWEGHPALDELIVFGPEESLWRVAGRIRAGRFDRALILPNSPRSALECWLAGIPVRIGYRRPWRNFFLTERVDPRRDIVPMRKKTPAEVKAAVSRGGPRETFPASSHHMLEYLHLASKLGASDAPVAPEVHVSDDERKAMQASISGSGAPETLPWVGLNPGAEYGPAKRWPVDRFVETAVQAAALHPCRFLIFGGTGDVALAAELQAGLERRDAVVRNLAGKTSLRQLCAALKCCSVLLTNDTGPMHLAAAVGTRVVVPFGSTSPELTGPGVPGDPRHRFILGNVPCAPCFLRECPIDFRCLLGIDPAPVALAVAEVLRSSPLS